MARTALCRGGLGIDTRRPLSSSYNERTMHPPSRSWTYWLLVACVGVILFGLDLVVAPQAGWTKACLPFAAQL